MPPALVFCPQQGTMTSHEAGRSIRQNGGAAAAMSSAPEQRYP